MIWDHISKHLSFKPTNFSGVKSIRPNDEVYLDSGSRIYRNYTKDGITFQLFLNDTEYKKIQKNFTSHYLHFYGDNYIYITTHFKDIIKLCKFMNWNNTNKLEWFILVQ